MQNDLKNSPDLENYKLVQNTIEWLHGNFQDQPDMAALSTAMNIAPADLTHLFKQWAGLTPMAFLQALTLDHARYMLRERSSILDTSYELGLSSAARLHDLFVVHEGMSPGSYKDKGAGLKMTYGFHPSPFGIAIIVVTDRGIAGLGFSGESETERKEGLEDLMRRWPHASYTENQTATAPYAIRIFSKDKWSPERPLKVVMIGTDFEIRVWETLLKIPLGMATTYGEIAKSLDKPKAARAVGTAVGKNPISFVVPCHRVLGSTGAITGYHWGLTRKRAMLGWEYGVVN